MLLVFVNPRSLIAKATCWGCWVNNFLAMSLNEEQADKNKANVSEATLNNNEVARYSRQMLVPNFGVQGQLKLKKSAILIVGAGGLGCPSALHLVGAGVGRIGIVDYDEVEITNLHRQLLHSEESVGKSKVESAKETLKKLNSLVEIQTFKFQLTSKNSMETLEKFDVVLDCTDNVATRYLLNDTCAMLKKPLVSGSALQYEGQLTVYNFANGPCYRCIFPSPPPPDAVTNCGDGGVLAPVTGVIGTLQAMEAIKIILDLNCMSGKLLIYDGLECSFRSVKLRNRNQSCLVCGDLPQLTELIDYEQFCRMKATDKDSHLNLLKTEERISVHEYKELRQAMKHLLIDVRSPNEFEMCKLDGSLNISLAKLLDEQKPDELIGLAKKNIPIIFVCRRGNDSQIAVKKLQQICPVADTKDIIGGLHAWTREIDPEFPFY